MYYSKTTIQSENSARYLNTLCRHFARKVPATWDEQQGEVNFLMGDCHFTLLAGNNQLEVLCSGKEIAQLTTVKSIVEQHFAMLSRRETININWSNDQQLCE